MDGEIVPLRELNVSPSHPADLVKKRADTFDGMGNFNNKDWDLAELYQIRENQGDVWEDRGYDFSWYHVELPKVNQKLSQSAKDLIGVLCPPLKLQDIISLVSNGPFCAYVDRGLVFRVNSPGPPSSDFTFRMAAIVMENSVITVSLGHVPRLGFSHIGESQLSQIPSVESSPHVSGTVFIEENDLESLLTVNQSEVACNPVPRSVSNLVVHIIDTHVHQLEDVVIKLEMELDSLELELDKGSHALKKQMLDDRRFPKLHSNFQRLLQVIAHGEQAYLKVKEKCSSIIWFGHNDINSIEKRIRRLRRLKENVGFIVNRVTAIQAGLDSWQSEQINRKLYYQSEQINRKLYYLSCLSIIFLPLSIITGGFGMNVGVPWTGQTSPELKNGFRNVLLLCVGMLLLVLLCFKFSALYTRIAAAWRSLNMNSLLRRHLRID